MTKSPSAGAGYCAAVRVGAGSQVRMKTAVLQNLRLQQPISREAPNSDSRAARRKPLPRSLRLEVSLKSGVLSFEFLKPVDGLQPAVLYHPPDAESVDPFRFAGSVPSRFLTKKSRMRCSPYAPPIP